MFPPIFFRLRISSVACFSFVRCPLPSHHLRGSSPPSSSPSLSPLAHAVVAEMPPSIAFHLSPPITHRRLCSWSETPSPRPSSLPSLHFSRHLRALSQTSHARFPSHRLRFPSCRRSALPPVTFALSLLSPLQSPLLYRRPLHLLSLTFLLSPPIPSIASSPLPSRRTPPLPSHPVVRLLSPPIPSFASSPLPSRRTPPLPSHPVVRLLSPPIPSFALLSPPIPSFASSPLPSRRSLRSPLPSRRSPPLPSHPVVRSPLPSHPVVRLLSPPIPSFALLSPPIPLFLSLPIAIVLSVGDTL
ncbi:unnamed protein product [Closterium sp. Naga37s-1]|nr:unnamed protein product [Closterium sp. Naga37s-1]